MASPEEWSTWNCPEWAIDARDAMASCRTSTKRDLTWFSKAVEGADEGESASEDADEDASEDASEHADEDADEDASEGADGGEVGDCDGNDKGSMLSW